MNMNKGSLEVLVHNATDLRDVEVFGEQDPFCVLTCGKFESRTNTHTDGGRNPIWNQFLTFNDVEKDMILKFEIFDDNVVLRNAKIGTGEVSLKDLKDGRAERLSIPVSSSRGKQRGCLQVTLTFKPSSRPSRNPSETSATGLSSPQSPSSSASSSGRWMLAYASTSVWKDYEAGILLGKGTLGTTFAAVDRKTAEQVAIKDISKGKVSRLAATESVQRHLHILRQLRCFRNVVKLRGQGVYEDNEHLSIVMDQCTGGDLLDAISQRKKFSERDAAAVIRAIVDVVAHCNNLNVIHRDVKPENFMFSNQSPSAILKVIDFGLSTPYEPGQVFTETVGSPYYSAPEMLNKHYGKEVDMWSCGVILYILLSGYPPFRGQSEKGLRHAVLSAPLDFTSHPWSKISEPAKDCIRRMLVHDPKKRATPGTILNHEWVRENGVAPDVPLDREVLLRMKQFSDSQRLKKKTLKEAFDKFDVNKDGSITHEELRVCLKNAQGQDTQDVMRRLDKNRDGRIDFHEFCLYHGMI